MRRATVAARRERKRVTTRAGGGLGSSLEFLVKLDIYARYEEQDGVLRVRCLRLEPPRGSSILKSLLGYVCA